MNRQLKFVATVLSILIGNTLYAVGIVFFVLPGGLVTGGTTGIGLFVNRLLGLDLSVFVFGFNVLMFLIGWACLGWKFAATTVLSTFCYPVILSVLERFAGSFVISTDRILCVVFGGICIGLGLGVVIRAGASTGGMDIPPLVLNKLFHLPVSVMLYVFDILILAMQLMTHTWEEVLYGCLMVIIYTVVLDKCLMIGTSKVEIKVISAKYEEIRQAILQDIDRGVTLLSGKTGYLEQETNLVLSVVSTKEIPRTRRMIHDIDPQAFLVITRVSEVRGRGFTENKEYK